jgi:hypothetical protein
MARGSAPMNMLAASTSMFADHGETELRAVNRIRYEYGRRYIILIIIFLSIFYSYQLKFTLFISYSCPLKISDNK